MVTHTSLLQALQNGPTTPFSIIPFQSFIRMEKFTVSSSFNTGLHRKHSIEFHWYDECMYEWVHFLIYICVLGKTYFQWVSKIRILYLKLYKIIFTEHKNNIEGFWGLYPKNNRNRAAFFFSSIPVIGRKQLTYLARLWIFTDNNIIFPGKFGWIVIDIQNSNTHCDMALQTRIVCKTHRDIFSISMHTLEAWFKTNLLNTVACHQLHMLQQDFWQKTTLWWHSLLELINLQKNEKWTPRHDMNTKMIFCHIKEIICYSGTGVGESCQNSLYVVRV